MILYNGIHVYETLWQVVQYFPWDIENCLTFFKWLRAAFAEGFILSVGIDMSLEFKNFYVLVIIFPHGILFYLYILILFVSWLLKK